MLKNERPFTKDEFLSRPKIYNQDDPFEEELNKIRGPQIVKGEVFALSEIPFTDQSADFPRRQEHQKIRISKTPATISVARNSHESSVKQQRSGER